METKAYKNIIYDKKPPIAYIIFNRPEKMNAFNMELQVEVDDALENAGWNDDEIRVVHDPVLKEKLENEAIIKVQKAEAAKAEKGKTTAKTNNK